MKKNLIKILATAAIALSVGACGKKSPKEPDPTEYTLDELLVLDSNGDWEHQGEKVKLCNLGVADAYGNTIIGGYCVPDSTSVLDLYGIEIQAKEMPVADSLEWADITVVGTLEDENGHAVIKDADVTLNSVYDKDAGTGQVCYYWNNVSRLYFDNYFGRSWSGKKFSINVQFASIPETVTTDKESSFYVVYPGEDKDLEDEDNLSPIEVIIPAGLSESTVSFINEYFTGKAVGDSGKVYGISRYDRTRGGTTIVLGDIIGSYGLKATPKDEAAIVKDTWADVQELEGDNYRDTMVTFENANIFSYVVDESSLSYNVEQYFNDPSWVEVEHNDAALLSVTINAKAAKMEETFESLVAGLKTQGGEASSVNNEDEGEAIYNFKDSEGTTWATVLLANYESYITLYYIGLKPIKSFSGATAFADAKAYYLSRATAFEKSLDSSASDRTTAIPDLSEEVSSVTVDYSNESSYKTYFASLGLISNYTIKATLKTASKDVVSNYLGTFYVAGAFTYKALTIFEQDGWFNSTTNEFVIFSYDDTYSTITLDIITLNAASAAYVTERSDALYISYMNSTASQYAGYYSSYFSSTINFVSDFTVTVDSTECAAEDWAYECDTSYLSQGYPVLFFTFDVYYADTVDVTKVASALAAELAATGAYTADVQCPTYTSGEWLGYADYTNGVWVGVDAYSDYGIVEITVVFGKNYVKAA